MANYPKEVTVKLKVFDNGRVEILDPPGIPLSDAFKEGKIIKGHNSIGVLVSNPTCLIVNGYMHCSG